MLHIVSPLPRVAGHHCLGPAVDGIVAQDTIIGSLICSFDNGVKSVHEVLEVGTGRAVTICPGDLVTAD